MHNKKEGVVVICHNLGSNCPNLYKVSRGACSELIVTNLVITSKKFYKYS